MICFLLGSALTYLLLMAVYRLRLHPLSKFPGPRLAAMTGLYEVYFAAWGNQSFETEIHNMHQQYGPVVRISPDEIHVEEQFRDVGYADCWIKGTRRVDAGRRSRRDSRPLTMRERSLFRVRSLIQVEVQHLLKGLAQQHQVHRGRSSRLRPLLQVPYHREIVPRPVKNSRPENGTHLNALRKPKRRCISKQLSIRPADLRNARLQNPRPVDGRAFHATVQMGRRGLPC
ncbi:hypothetical protein NUU61_000936 [Penicillium alfredii]|uniref:Cytochrome P450 n=1 Tax=Penicillium alfredii TaxID=1506179 RepID=A0A9W9GBM1_9EURO|nr:uncharacterized protein NUU61_000936 [Penicillium alfredii]KAJ5115177.1 hypothetical protein NUU61_000936 [Penicillium alfredii]